METKTYDGQTGKFLAKVAENMPKVPASIMQAWIENPTGLKKVLAEALLPPQTSQFEIWKTIRIGGLPNADAIRKDIKRAGMKISNYADDILGKIPLSKEEREIDLVLLSLADLDFENGAKYGEICKRAKERGLEMCPAEVGPYLRSQYGNQPNGELAIIAMEPITDSGGVPLLFRVGRGGVALWLGSFCGNSDGFWFSDDRFAFVLPQVKIEHLDS